MNHHQTGSHPADFKRYLTSNRIAFLPADLIEALATAQAYCDGIHVEGAKFSIDAANSELGRIANEARSTPSAENLLKLSETTHDQLHTRYESVRILLGDTFEGYKLQKVRPLLRRVHALAAPLIAEQIELAARSGAARAEVFGVRYDRSEDTVVAALLAFQTRAKQYLLQDGPRESEPGAVAHLFGDLRPLAPSAAVVEVPDAPKPATAPALKTAVEITTRS